MGNEQLLSEFHAAGRDDVLRLYEEMVEENDAAKERICAAFDEASRELGNIRGVGVELGRVRDALRAGRHVVASSDVTPHPSAADQLLEAHPELASRADEEAIG
jgi:hypothetical protein